MTLNSIYSLTIAIKKETSPISKVLGQDVISAFIKNEPTLRFLTCQSRKHNECLKNFQDDVEVWTILSSGKFGKKNKAPQESIPREKVVEVIDLMLSSLEKSLCLEEGTIHSGLVLDSRLQLWGAAVPLNTWTGAPSTEKEGIQPSAATGFLYDAEYGVGACGDWLLDPSIGGAWESGRRLSNWIVESDQALSVGLPPGGAFRSSKATADSSIGNIR